MVINQEQPCCYLQDFPCVLLWLERAEATHVASTTPFHQLLNRPQTDNLLGGVEKIEWKILFLP
jgi:hypothetical protein